MNATEIQRMQKMARKESNRAKRLWETGGDIPKGDAPAGTLADRLQELLGRGMTQREAAEKLHTSQALVSYHLRRRGWKL